jgi:tRNA pseudouridine38-40 synthase
MRYFMHFSYLGKHYHGWQRQPASLTVQEAMEERLKLLLGGEVALVAAGRTDTGVHAREMVAHFDWEAPLDDAFLERYNAFLPEDIVVRGIRRVHPEAHARFSALARTYEYHLIQQRDPFALDTACFVRQPLDFKGMNTAAAYLMEFDDFKAFSRSQTDVKTYLCKITRAAWEPRGGTWVFTITADRFLRNMVRAVVGTLLEVGKGRMAPEGIKEIISSRDRSRAGVSVPAKGLYLTEITYPEGIYLTDGER